MAQFRVWLKDREATVVVKAEKAETDNNYLTFLNGNEQTAMFLLKELQGYKKEEAQS